MSFNEILKRAAMSKIELAHSLSLNLGTVYNWGRDAPPYAMEYLRVVIELNAYKELSK